MQNSRSRRPAANCARTTLLVPAEDDNDSSGFAELALQAYERDNLPQWTIAQNFSRLIRGAHRDFGACMRLHCAGSEPTKYNPEVCRIWYFQVYSLVLLIIVCIFSSGRIRGLTIRESV